METIALIQLVNGQHLIGKIANNYEDSIVLQKARQVRITQEPNNPSNAQIHLLPVGIPFLQNDYRTTIYKSSIAFMQELDSTSTLVTKSEEQFITEYKKQISPIMGL
jgi:hypothetical protein